jgi:hypothetical protein
MSTLQELADRLVVATEEQDVLFCLWSLAEMRNVECLKEAINRQRESSSSLKGIK